MFLIMDSCFFFTSVELQLWALFIFLRVEKHKYDDLELEMLNYS